ncbi:Thioredoxin reductase [Nannocystis exedens]|uniref:Thioredoxin reductase n=1 Tax=Nannocystis exedens TaxID=54 RepID=A0A1I2I557_9BACT|nr:NAD(P)/FAD-dependent oxidoreductase [Nannocystis exedens]PCC73569.1 Thioredoxin reductase [Nannocystis exedens]SFF37465.1 Thioredoxin reductase [Nannocystis exedens]
MYDVIIVGGGPAGLSAALVLGRSDRSVLVCDRGDHRNDSSRAVHGFLTREGTPPDELLRLGREQLRPYKVEFAAVPVTDAVRESPGFLVSLADGRRARCRKLLLATGLVDLLPPIAGLGPLWGRSVFVCPYCDGWEFRGAPLAACGAEGAALALSLLRWSQDVMLFTNGGRPLAGDETERLAAAGVRVREEPIERLEGHEGTLERVVLAGGEAEPRRALFLKLPQRQRSDLAEKLALPVDDKHGAETRRRQSTRVPGLYLAGDASRDVMFAIVAAAEGAVAGMTIDGELQAEELAERVRRGSPASPGK